MSRPVSPPRTNADQTVAQLLAAFITPAQANQVRDPTGSLQVAPGQGGVVLGPALGSPAGPWVSDHLEPGASLGHPDPTVHAALQAFCCIGNPVVVRTGAARGAHGLVYGKHGAILAQFDQDDLERMAPGDQVAVRAHGTGLRLVDRPHVAVHSCSPHLLEALLSTTGDGRLGVSVAVVFPPQAAAAGIGMPASSFNLDLDPKAVPALTSLAFGAVIALTGHDHRFGRQRRDGWTAIGAVVHGRSVGGGHGLGMITLLSGPSEEFALSVAADANLTHLLRIPSVIDGQTAGKPSLVPR
jgi:hypothetical protein